MTDPRGAMPTLEVYVWFEADPGDDALVRAAFVRLDETMARGGSDASSERPRLLRRPETTTRDGAPRATWMEVWPQVPRRALVGWLARLSTSATSSGTTALAQGGRHVEPFEPQRVASAA